MKIARVFPRKTKATPTDDLVFFDYPSLLTPEVDEVHVSVTFTYDIEKAEDLYYQWEQLGVPIKIGGPAMGDKTTEFIPGRYLKEGFVRTSVGCNNNCWFCKVPGREGPLRELPVQEGYNIIDDNFLQCSKAHKQAVFNMLSQQKERPIFSGGLEAKILTKWDAQLLAQCKPKSIYFAYDTPDDYEPLVAAGKLLREEGITPRSHVLCCYVLIGYKGDTFEKAEKRLIDTMRAGFMPFSMLYRDDTGAVSKEWVSFNTDWCNKIVVGMKYSDYLYKRSGG